MRARRIMASRRILGPNGRPFEVERRPSIEGSYDAAQTTTLNTRHWAATDALSADQANSYSVRKTLRERARLEVANSPFLAGVVDRFSMAVVGRAGPALQILMPEAREIAQEIERHFAQWARAIRLGRKLRTLERARLVDGEGFALLIHNEQVDHPIKLDVVLMECDRVHSPSTEVYEDRTNVDGVIVDKSDNVINYQVLKEHPGGLEWVKSSNSDLYAPEFVIHWFGRERPEQHRGVSEVKASLQMLPLFRRYLLAVVQAAEFAAEINGVLSVNAPASGEDEADRLDDFDAFAPERGLVWVAPYGYQMTQVKPEQPPTTLPEFRRAIWSECALPQHMPRNIAMADSSDYNFASGRLDHGTYYDGIGVRQGDMGLEAMDKVLSIWLKLARSEWRWPGAITATHEWLWTQRKPIDPREAAAEVERLMNGITNFPEIYAARGLDWRIEFEKAAEALGISFQEYQALLRQTLFQPKDTAEGAGAKAMDSADLEAMVRDMVEEALAEVR